MPQVIAYRTALGNLIKSATTGDWENDVQDASTATFVSNVNLTGTGTSAKSSAIAASYGAGRGGNSGTVSRVFAEFSIPSEAQGNITAITLRLLSYNSSTGNAIVAKSNAAPLNGTTYQASDFNDYTTTAYSAVQNKASANTIPAWPTSTSTTTTFDIPLNSTAVSDANSNNILKIVFMNYDHDFEVSEPSLGTFAYNGIRFVNGTSDTYGKRMRIVIDYETGYGNNVSGVASANIAKINGVATANIAKVSGVS